MSLCPTRPPGAIFPWRKLIPRSDSIFPVPALRGVKAGERGAFLPGPPTPIPLIHGVRSQGRDRRFLHAKYGDSVLHLMPPSLEIFFFLIVDSFIQLPEYLLCARHALEA